MNQVIHGDCLEVMPTLPDKSIDMILCDLPYGTTACKWDTVIPFEPLWREYKRLIKDKGAIVLTASQPFTSALVMSNPDMFRYCWVWDKRRPSNPMLAKTQCLKTHEDICVFYTRLGIYNPQGVFKTDGKPRGGVKPSKTKLGFGKGVKHDYKQTESGYPKSIITFGTDNTKNVHPTQKPVALFEYLIKTYTNEGETVLDNCAGSGTTAIACLNTNRNYILIEKEQEYIDIINKRIAEHEQQQTLFN